MASLLDRSPEWIGYLGYSSERGYVERRFLLDAIGYLQDLVDGVGWDAEYPRDIWLLRRLGYPGRDSQLRFDRDRADLAAAVDQTLDPLAAVDRTPSLATVARGCAGDHPVRAVVPVAAARARGADPGTDRGPPGASDGRDIRTRRRRTGQIGSLAGLLRDRPPARLGATADRPRRPLPRRTIPA